MKTATIKIYSQKRISENGHKGWLFTWVEIYDNNTVSTEKQNEVWIADKKEAYNEFMLNKQLKQTHLHKVTNVSTKTSF